MYYRELLLLFFLFTKSLYVPLNRRQSRHYWKTSIDDRIPLLPLLVVPYVVFIPYMVLSIALLWNTIYVVPLLESLSFAYVVASLFWYFVPNGVKRPDIIEKKLHHRILVYIYKSDHDTNGFPSAHVFVTLICAYFLHIARVPFVPLSWFVAGTIALSTIFTKQHYVVDLFGGIIMFLLSVTIFL